jgi:hypothetical protein
MLTTDIGKGCRDVRVRVRKGREGLTVVWVVVGVWYAGRSQLGTLTTDIGKAVKLAKQGQVEFRGDKSAIIHAIIGKVGNDGSALSDDGGSLRDDGSALNSDGSALMNDASAFLFPSPSFYRLNFVYMFVIINFMMKGILAVIALYTNRLSK